MSNLNVTSTNNRTGVGIIFGSNSLDVTYTIFNESNPYAMELMKYLRGVYDKFRVDNRSLRTRFDPNP